MHDDIPPLLGIADIAARWRYTRQGVHHLLRRADFPEPAVTFNEGRTKAWARADIEAYERNRPELGDPEAKRRKVVGYLLALQKGPAHEETG